MIVQDIMQRTVVTVSPGAPLDEVATVLQRRGVRHVPVLDGQALAGIISDRDLKGSMASTAVGGTDTRSDRLTAGDIMTRKVITIGPMFPVEEAARIMASRRISALPVTEADRLVGLVTETDIVLLFVRAMGVLEPSTRLDVVLPDERRALSRIVQILEEHGAPVSSIVTLKATEGWTEAVIRVATINPGAAVHALEAERFSVRDNWRG